MKSIGTTLGNIRKEYGFSRKEVAEKLHEMGIEISDKTLYGYETGRTSANADMFLALCNIYGIKDIFSTFDYDGYNDDGSPQLNQSETIIIEKYRALDSHGRKMVDFTLENEYQRSIANVVALEPKDDYLAPFAAHDRTDIEVTDEMRKHDEDLITSDDF